MSIRMQQLASPCSIRDRTVGMSAVVLLFLLLMAGLVRGQTDGQPDGMSDPDTPQYEHLFNCLCDMKVEDGEIDTSGNCGKPLANCSCGFAKKMRSQLNTFDERGLGRREQIEAFKEQYSQFENKVLAVPDPGNSNWFLAYLVPPVIIVLALLFVGGTGWYWLENRIRSEENGDDADSAVDHDEIRKEIEREIEEHQI